MIVPDFETRSKCDLKKRGVYCYARDPSTDILCLSWKVDDEQTRIWMPHHPGGDDINELYELIRHSDHRLCAHNANFEMQIWRWVMERKYGAPAIPLQRWDCSAAQCAALALPRALENAGKALTLNTQKDKHGHRLMLQLSKPRPKMTFANLVDVFNEPGVINDDKFRQVYAYCIRDVETQSELTRLAPNLPASEKEVWRLDQVINERGIPVDRENIKRALTIEALYRKHRNNDLAELTGGQVTAATQRDRMLWWLNNRGVNIDGLAAAKVAEALEEEDLDEESREVLTIRQELGKSSTKKLQSMLDRANEDGRVRGSMLYHGASTGRWAGAGIQIHNYPSRGLVVKKDEIDLAVNLLQFERPEPLIYCYGSVLKTLSSLLRLMVCASPGKVFRVVDFSGIEARVLARLAYDWPLVQAFRDGTDAYVQLAAAIFGKRQEEVADEERQLGKIAILGCGYGMGWRKFQDTCAAWGTPIDGALAEQIVSTYREVHQRIKHFWYGVERAAVECVQTGQSRQFNDIRFHLRRPFLHIELPSGRELSYCEPDTVEVEVPWGGTKPQLRYMAVDSKTKQWKRHRSYGGLLVENITQALARDFLVAAMLRLEQAGYTIIATVHDEVITEDDETFGSLDEVIDIMCQLPKWATNYPIGAEGFEGKRYRK